MVYYHSLGSALILASVVVALPDPSRLNSRAPAIGRLSRVRAVLSSFPEAACSSPWIPSNRHLQEGKCTNIDYPFQSFVATPHPRRREDYAKACQIITYPSRNCLGSELASETLTMETGLCQTATTDQSTLAQSVKLVCDVEGDPSAEFFDGMGASDNDVEEVQALAAGEEFDEDDMDAFVVSGIELWQDQCRVNELCRCRTRPYGGSSGGGGGGYGDGGDDDDFYGGGDDDGDDDDGQDCFQDNGDGTQDSCEPYICDPRTTTRVTCATTVVDEPIIETRTERVCRTEVMVLTPVAVTSTTRAPQRVTRSQMSVMQVPMTTVQMKPVTTRVAVVQTSMVPVEITGTLWGAQPVDSYAGPIEVLGVGRPDPMPLGPKPGSGDDGSGYGGADIRVAQSGNSGKGAKNGGGKKSGGRGSSGGDDGYSGSGGSGDSGSGCSGGNANVRGGKSSGGAGGSDGGYGGGAGGSFGGGSGGGYGSGSGRGAPGGMGGSGYGGPAQGSGNGGGNVRKGGNGGGGYYVGRFRGSDDPYQAGDAYPDGGENSYHADVDGAGNSYDNAGGAYIAGSDANTAEDPYGPMPGSATYGDAPQMTAAPASPVEYYYPSRFVRRHQQGFYDPRFGMKDRAARDQKERQSAATDDQSDAPRPSQAGEPESVTEEVKSAEADQPKATLVVAISSQSGTDDGHLSAAVPVQPLSSLSSGAVSNATSEAATSAQSSSTSVQLSQSEVTVSSTSSSVSQSVTEVAAIPLKPSNENTNSDEIAEQPSSKSDQSKTDSQGQVNIEGSASTEKQEDQKQSKDMDSSSSQSELAPSSESSESQTTITVTIESDSTTDSTTSADNEGSDKVTVASTDSENLTQSDTPALASEPKQEALDESSSEGAIDTESQVEAAGDKYENDTTVTHTEVATENSEEQPELHLTFDLGSGSPADTAEVGVELPSEGRLGMVVAQCSQALADDAGHVASLAVSETAKEGEEVDETVTVEEESKASLGGYVSDDQEHFAGSTFSTFSRRSAPTEEIGSHMDRAASPTATLNREGIESSSVASSGSGVMGQGAFGQQNQQENTIQGSEDEGVCSSSPTDNLSVAVSGPNRVMFILHSISRVGSKKRRS